MQGSVLQASGKEGLRLGGLRPEQAETGGSVLGQYILQVANGPCYLQAQQRPPFRANT